MTALPLLAILTVTVAIGAWLGYQYLTGVRNSRNLVAAHLILGLVATEVLALTLRGAPVDATIGATETPSRLGYWGAGFIVAALFSGLMTPLLARPLPQRVGLMLAVHAGIATTGFGLLLVWAIQR